MRKYFFLMAMAGHLHANMNPKIGFEPYMSSHFVETGTFDGSGIQFALRAGFKNIYSVELNDLLFNLAKKKFAQNKNIHLFHGDSGKILWDVIKNIDDRITFWLDGHNGVPDPNGGKNTPLMEELEQIKWHPHKDHIIIIDDMHCCGTILFDGFTREDIANKVLEINSNYVISYIPGGDDGEYPENIMIAHIE